MPASDRPRPFTVARLAALSGVSVRTLHHYDAIGLLRPAETGKNGYRLYGRDQRVRLQRILFYRELGMPLAEIAGALDASPAEQVAALQDLRARLQERRRRDAELLKTLDQAIKDHPGEITITDDQMFKGFSPERQAEYEAWLAQTYGAETRATIDDSRAARARISPAERDARMQAMREMFAELRLRRTEGITPGDRRLDGLIARHVEWIAVEWGRRPGAEAYAGLGELYAGHPDFLAWMDAEAPGFAAWLCAAMAAYAKAAL